MPADNKSTLSLREFAQPAVAFLAIGICVLLWALAARPLPSVGSPAAATPLADLTPPPGPRPSVRARPYAAGAPSSFSVGQEVAARKLYSKTCAPCHTGQQDLFKVGNYRHGSDDQAVFHSIKIGFPGTGMAGSGLSDEVIWDLVYFLRSNRK